MEKDSDDPNLPHETPIEVEYLEELDPASLNAMTPVELEEKIRDAADGLAKQYVRHHGEKGSLEDCASFVAGALQQMGQAIEGRPGSTLVGTSTHEGHRACKAYFSDLADVNELEY